MVVAAGNEAADACMSSPAGATGRYIDLAAAFVQCVLFLKWCKTVSLYTPRAAASPLWPATVPMSSPRSATLDHALTSLPL